MTYKPTFSAQFLIDNVPHPDNTKLHSEHGLSMLFKWHHDRILFDVGLTPHFAQNAEALNIDITDISHLVLSHGHKDHTGGLGRFFEQNVSADVWAAENITKYKYFSMRHEKPRDISFKVNLLLSYKQYHPVRKSMWLTEDMAFITNIPRHYRTPQANNKLEVSNIDGSNQHVDAFDHEIVIALKDEDGLIILSPCSHNGLLNILEACTAFTGETRVKAFIGGLHLLDDFVSTDELDEIVEVCQAQYPGMQIYTGHCTGDEAKAHLEQAMPNQVHFFFTGMYLEL